MEALIGALSGAGASLPQTSKEWRRRLRNVDAPFVLCQTLAEIEEQVSNLADGPPAGEHLTLAILNLETLNLETLVPTY